MESPLKKRKVTSQGSLVAVASSTPRSTLQSVLIEPSFLSVSEFNSYSNYKSPNSSTRKSLKFSGDKENQNVEIGERIFSDLLEDTQSSLAESVLQDEGEDELDYDEFFKKCKRIVLRGHVWNLYKPIGEEEGSLYHQVISNPRDAPELAKWFAQYCSQKSAHVAAYVLYRLYFDCSGYQKFNLKKYFEFPPKFDALFKKLNNPDYTGDIILTKKYLFADNARLAIILKFGIYNFIQKFVCEAHENEVLYQPAFPSFLQLLICMCTSASVRPLLHTASIFVIKLLSSVCMVKEQIGDLHDYEKHNEHLDNYINILYMCFTRICRIPDKDLATQKIVGIKELMVWINYSPQIFVDHFVCTNVLKQFLVDESSSVRLAALEACIKVVQNEKLVSHLKAEPREALFTHIEGRISDINILVGLKAIEVVTAMSTHYSENMGKRSLYEKLFEILFHKDYRMASAAGKCVIELFIQQEYSELSSILYMGRIARKYRPIPLVEACIDHTDMLQNWSLFLHIFLKCSNKETSIELKTTVSELLLESVHLTLTGNPSIARLYSKMGREVNSANHGLIANEIYPQLKRILGMYKNDDVIIQNFFKLAIKIAPEYLTKEHCKVVDDIIQLCLRFFEFWNNEETLTTFVNYLEYVNQSLPLVKSTCRNAIEDLKQYVSAELYKSVKSRDNQTLIMATKSAVVFSKFDLNEHIAWPTLSAACHFIESNAKYIEDIMTCCHWSLLWIIKKLFVAQLPSSESKPNLSKEIRLISNMLTQFFPICSKFLKHKEKSIKLKAFERICETCISISHEVENISKQVRALDSLKPNLRSDVEFTKNILDVFELSAEPSVPSDAGRFRKYILNIYSMCCLNVLPMDSVSVAFKYFDKYYDIYGKLFERILDGIRTNKGDWIPLLMVNTISLLHQDILNKHGVVDVRSLEAKAILSLSIRFHDLKKVMTPRIATRILMFAVNYASETELYDFLIYVRVFIEDLRHFPDHCKEIQNTIKEVMSPTARKSDAVLYFAKHLQGPTAATPASTPKAKPRKGLGKTPLAPKRKTRDPKIKGKKLFTTPSQSTDSGGSDRMSIHDTSSDDLQFGDSPSYM